MAGRVFFSRGLSLSLSASVFTTTHCAGCCLLGMPQFRQPICESSYSKFMRHLNYFTSGLQRIYTSAWVSDYLETCGEFEHWSIDERILLNEPCLGYVLLCLVILIAVVAAYVVPGRSCCGSSVFPLSLRRGFSFSFIGFLSKRKATGRHIACRIVQDNRTTGPWCTLGKQDRIERISDVIVLF